MKTSLLWKRLLMGCLLLALLAGCATATPEPTATPVPPTDTPELTSCEEVDGICLELTFDGESCTYEGPTKLKTGPAVLLFLNESEGTAVTNLVRHTGGETIQDAIDNIGEEPSTKHHPSWTVEVHGVYRTVMPGMSHTWEGVLEPGIYHMVCARLSPLGVWFGTGLAVED